MFKNKKIELKWVWVGSIFLIPTIKISNSYIAILWLKWRLQKNY